MTNELDTIQKLETEANAESADKLQEIERTTSLKEIRKAARRALYTLSLKGIAPTRRRQDASATAPESERMRVFASAYDGAGNRLLLFLLADPDGGSYLLVQILTNDQEGVRDCESARLPRRSLDERIEQFKKQVESGIALAEVDFDYGRWLLAQARAINQTLSRRSPSDLIPLLRRIGEPQNEYEPPIYSKIPDVDPESTTRQDASDLFEMLWFEPWFFAAEDMLPWLGRWDEALQAGGLEEKATPDSAIYKLTDEAAAALMTDTMRAIYTHRLEETADVLWRCGKEQAAALAVKHARDLNSPAETIGIPFVHEIVLRSLGASFELVKAYRERRAGG